MPATIDLHMTDHGSICLVHPDTDRGRDWLAFNIPPSAEVQYFGSALAVEPRFVWGVLEAAMGSGLVVR